MLKANNTKEKAGANRTLAENYKGLRNLEEIMTKARKAGYSLFM